MFDTLRQWVNSLIERVIDFLRGDIEAIEDRLEEVLSWVEEAEIEDRLEEVLNWIEEAEAEAEKEELEEETAELKIWEIEEELESLEEELEFLAEELEFLEEETEEREEYYATHLEELKTQLEEGEDVTEEAFLAAELAEEDGFNDLAEAFLELAIRSEEQTQNLNALLALLNEAQDFDDIETVWEMAQELLDESLLDLLLERIEFAPPEPYPT